MAVQEGAKYLEKLYGGRGVLLGGVPGVAPAKVVILGGGIVGINAAKMAAGMGAKVVILDVSLERLRYLSDVMPANVQLIFSNRHNIVEQISTADLVVGGVLIPGAKAPKLVRREDLAKMRPGSVIVDVAIDQGGCVETIHATTHENPTYVVDGVIHYGVANMPGGVPRTSTLALTNATLPYAVQLANKGWKQALRDNGALLVGTEGAGLWTAAAPYASFEQDRKLKADDVNALAATIAATPEGVFGHTGRTWKRISEEVEVIALAPADGRCFAGTAGGEVFVIDAG
jgi:alanine dehydrogenase